MSSHGRKARLLESGPTDSDCHAYCTDTCRNQSHCEPLTPLLPESPINSTADAGVRSSTTVHIRSSSHLVPVLPIAGAAFAGAVLMIFLVIFALLWVQRRRRRRNLIRGVAAVFDGSTGGEEDDGDGDVVDHHVWYIRTKGLDQSAIEAITALEYKSGDGIIGAGVSDCAVCLGEFRDGELLRLLPKCGHAFHLNCIDTWLRSHVNCPLCRAPIEVLRVASGRRGRNEGPLPLSQPLSRLSSGARHQNPGLGPLGIREGNQVIVGNRVPESDGQLVRMVVGGERSELGVGSGISIGRVPSYQLSLNSSVEETQFMPIHRSASMNSIPFVSSIDGTSSKYDFVEEDNKDSGSQGNGSNGHTRAKSSILPL